MSALQVLHAEPDGGQRILDLMCHLSRHLAPSQHALRHCKFAGIVQRENAPPLIGLEHGDLGPDAFVANGELLGVRFALPVEKHAHPVPQLLPLRTGLPIYRFVR